MNFFKTLKTSLIMAGVFFCNHLVAQEFVQMKSAQSMAITSSQASIQLDFKIQSGYHIQASQPEVSWVIPTRVTLASDLPLGKVEFPESWELPWPGEENPMQVYKCLFNLNVPLVSAPKPGTYRLRGTVYYQACDRSKCYFPRSLEFEVEVKVVASKITLFDAFSVSGAHPSLTTKVLQYSQHPVV